MIRRRRFVAALAAAWLWSHGGLSLAQPRATTGEPPRFSDAARRTPREAIAYLAGRHPEYPGSGPESVFDFSVSDILETMDTVWLDWVERVHGIPAILRVHEAIARAALATLEEQYPEGWILVPVEAGHGGTPGHWWDPGSEGTEAEHTRTTVAAMERLAGGEFPRVVVRPIHHDSIPADFGLPASLDKRTVSSILLRQARASMLAAEAAAWNRVWRDPAEQVAVHEISVHYNAGAGGAMVLHQGSTVDPDRARRSRAFAERYLQRVVADLNATGLLPWRLRRWAVTGLHDDVMMYRPAYFRDDEIRGITLRYGALQGRGGYLGRYVGIVLARHGVELGTP